MSTSYLQEKEMRLHAEKADVRDRLEQDGLEEVVPTSFNYSTSTHEYYQDPDAQPCGRYAEVRAKLDPSFHGSYSRERQALQDRLLDDALRRPNGSIAAPSASPWIVFTAGAMGSGKSRTFEYLAEKGIVPLQNIQILDPDMFKASLPEWRGYLRREPLSAGLHTRRESGYLLEIAQEIALREQRHVWVDGSLRDGEWYQKEFARIRREHPAYNIAIVHVVASREVVMKRVLSRAAVTGRIVPEAEIDDSMTRVPKAVALLAPQADFIAVVDNSADTPHLVEYCDGETCFVEDEALDGWAELSERLSTELAGREYCDVFECDETPEDAWERIAKNFEAARREAIAGGQEWG